MLTKALCTLALAFSILITGCGEPEANPNGKKTIAVIPKGTTHEFWKSVEAGAKSAGQEADVNIIWKGPLKEDDRSGQISVVENFITQKVDAIVLAPLDDRALSRPVANAKKAGIAVVIIDSSLQGEAGKDFVSYVATDNTAGGKLGGDELVRIMDGKGKIVLLRYQVGSASTTQRETGFLTAAKKPELEMLVDNQYAGATAGDAKTAALNLADQLRQADGVFCPNESSTFGMLLALRDLGLAGKVKFVGFDTSKPLIDALRKGEIHALVAQNPNRMGYLGVQTAARHLSGESVEKNIDTGCMLITKENLDSPEVKKLLGE